jgi:hypothetical protein
MRNLELIRASRRPDCSGGHEVTQIINSLLGLVIFPFSEGPFGSNDVKEAANGESLEVWQKAGRQNWDISLANCKCSKEKNGRTVRSIRCLVYHVRNAAAHGRLRFSSDDRLPHAVTISAEDGPNKEPFNANWSAKIVGSDLFHFCEELAKIVATNQ